jgi:hypothetical protein
LLGVLTYPYQCQSGTSCQNPNTYFFALFAWESQAGTEADTRKTTAPMMHPSDFQKASGREETEDGSKRYDTQHVPRTRENGEEKDKVGNTTPQNLCESCHAQDLYGISFRMHHLSGTRATRLGVGSTLVRTSAEVARHRDAFYTSTVLPKLAPP